MFVEIRGYKKWFFEYLLQNNCNGMFVEVKVGNTIYCCHLPLSNSVYAEAVLKIVVKKTSFKLLCSALGAVCSNAPTDYCKISLKTK